MSIPIPTTKLRSIVQRLQVGTEADGMQALLEFAVLVRGGAAAMVLAQAEDTKKPATPKGRGRAGPLKRKLSEAIIRRVKSGKNVR